MKRSVLVPLIVACLGMTAVASSLGARPSSGRAAPEAVAGCSYGWGTSVLIRGRARCLRTGGVCQLRLNGLYRRYAFICRQGKFDVLWDVLRRPLHVPTIAAGSLCPTTAASSRGTLGQLTGELGSSPAWGTGPAYPFIHDASEAPVITFRLPPQPGWGSEWGGDKVIWLSSSAYGGPLLVRGRQLDGPNEVRFENGSPGFTAQGALNPATELRFESGGGHPATTRLRAPGCYAYQLDGVGFSRLIVFEGRLAGS